MTGRLTPEWLAARDVSASCEGYPQPGAVMTAWLPIRQGGDYGHAAFGRCLKGSPARERALRLLEVPGVAEVRIYHGLHAAALPGKCLPGRPAKTHAGSGVVPYISVTHERGGAS